MSAENTENIDSESITLMPPPPPTPVLAPTLPNSETLPYLDKLMYISTKIKNMDKSYHVLVKEILKKHNVRLNKMGEKIAINLSIVDPSIIEEVFVFIKYAEEQEGRLKVSELQMNEIKNEHFSEM
jgi:hypothetical protein